MGAHSPWDLCYLELLAPSPQTALDSEKQVHVAISRVALARKNEGSLPRINILEKCFKEEVATRESSSQTYITPQVACVCGAGTRKVFSHGFGQPCGLGGEGMGPQAYWV